MPRRNFLIQITALVVLVVFAYCLVRLLLFRCERGDVYPAYSTLRADPLGTRVFYEALQSNGVAVDRGYHMLPRELENKPASIYYLALSADEILTFDKDEVVDLDDFVRNGGRVVITFAPEQPIAAEDKKTNLFAHKKKKTDGGAKKDSEDKDKEKTPEPPPDEDASQPQTAQEKYERDELRREKENDPDWEKDHMDTHYHRSLAASLGFWLGTTDIRKAENGPRPFP